MFWLFWRTNKIEIIFVNFSKASLYSAVQFRSVDTLFYYALCHIKVYIHLNIIVKLLNRLGIENNQNHMVCRHVINVILTPKGGKKQRKEEKRRRGRKSRRGFKSLESFRWLIQSVIQSAILIIILSVSRPIRHG